MVVMFNNDDKCLKTTEMTKLKMFQIHQYMYKYMLYFHFTLDFQDRESSFYVFSRASILEITFKYCT